MSTPPMRIRLIEPQPSGHNIFERIKLPRLGLPLMGAILRDRGHDVRIYCQDIKPIDYADVFDADLVGISLTTSTAPAGYHLAGMLRERNIPVAVGGPHVTFLPDEALRHADYCVRNEGEDAIVELVEHIANGSEPVDVLGLSYKNNGEVVHNPGRPPIDDLDALPFPALDLIHGSDRMRIRPVQTSRGCPFDCVFCSVTSMFGRRYRHRSIENIVEELQQYRGRTVFFYDDNFTASRTRARQLFEEIIRADLRINWSAQTRVDVAQDEELLDLMHRSGCYMLYIGLESINPAALEAFDKHQKVEQIEECIRRLHKHKIMVHGMFISGADQDVPQLIRNTASFAIKKRIDTIQLCTLTPIPGTRLYDQLDQDGRIITKDWHLYDGHHVVFEPQMMSPYTLHMETLRALKKFYAPLQVAKLLLHFKFIVAFFRYYGYCQIRKWQAANRDFSKWIRSVGERARELCQVKKPASDTME